MLKKNVIVINIGIIFVDRETCVNIGHNELNKISSIFKRSRVTNLTRYI